MALIPLKAVCNFGLNAIGDRARVVHRAIDITHTFAIANRNSVDTGGLKLIGEARVRARSQRDKNLLRSHLATFAVLFVDHRTVIDFDDTGVGVQDNIVFAELVNDQRTAHNTQ